MQLMPVLMDEGIEQSVINEITECVRLHDQSKWDQEEYDAYLAYFYPMDDQDKDELIESAFDMAWLHHQKVTPHHWQYWILIRDEGKQVPMDMPLKYVIEMLCDWQSMGYKYGDTAFDWWTNNKDKMIMSDNTRTLVDKYVKHLKKLVEDQWYEFEV